MIKNRYTASSARGLESAAINIKLTQKNACVGVRIVKRKSSTLYSHNGILPLPRNVAARHALDHGQRSICPGRYIMTHICNHWYLPTWGTPTHAFNWSQRSVVEIDVPCWGYVLSSVSCSGLQVASHLVSHIQDLPYPGSPAASALWPWSIDQLQWCTCSPWRAYLLVPSSSHIRSLGCVVPLAARNRIRSQLPLHRVVAVKQETITLWSVQGGCLSYCIEYRSSFSDAGA